MKPENRPKIVFEGKKYDDYQATQKQRSLERTIRKWRRRKAAAVTEEDKTAANIRLRRLNEKYHQFSKAAGLPEQRERTEVAWGIWGSGKSKLTLPVGTDKIESSTSSLEGYRPLTVEQVKQVMTDQVQALPEEQRQVLQRYTGFLATRINMAIRQGKITPELQKEIDLLDAALKDGVMPETVVFHRDTTLSYLGLGLPNEPTAAELSKIVRHTTTNPIFTSTSFDNLRLPGRNTEIWLTVPAGYRGCQFIQSEALPKYKDQLEVLFARGLKYRITDARIENGKYILSAEVLK